MNYPRIKVQGLHGGDTVSRALRISAHDAKLLLSHPVVRPADIRWAPVHQRERHSRSEQEFSSASIYHT